MSFTIKDQPKKKGRGWHGDQKNHQRAGAKGGNATVNNQGNDFYARIGRSGGKISGGNFKNNRALASRAGKIGGLAKGKKSKA